MSHSYLSYGIPSMPIKPSVAPSVDIDEPEVAAPQRLPKHPLASYLEAYEITPDKVLPKRDFLFKLFEKPCFARGELVAVTGKSKSGKTFFCSSVLAAASAGACLGLHRNASEPLHALWIDTEQSEESTQEILNLRIRVLSGSNPLPRVFNLRGITWDQRMTFVEAAIEETMPDIVIFDGIRDVVSDINDGVMAQQVVEQTMRLASGGAQRPPCCIVCVLHQNKAAEDSTLRGALGTELMNKCFETYECKKQEGGIFQVEQTSTRKYDIRDKIQFTVSDNGLPSLLIATSVQQTEGTPTENPYIYYEDGKRKARIIQLLQDCLPNGKELPQYLLVEEIEHRIGNKLWAEKLFCAVQQHGNLVSRTGEDGIPLYALRLA